MRVCRAEAGASLYAVSDVHGYPTMSGIEDAYEMINTRRAVVSRVTVKLIRSDTYH